MLLFKPEHVEAILDRRKTQTRRIWKRCRVRVGSVHQAYTRPAWAKPAGTPFARLRVTGHREERLGEITHADALAEGYDGVENYLQAFARINKIDASEIPMDMSVHVVDFELEEPAR